MLSLAVNAEFRRPTRMAFELLCVAVVIARLVACVWEVVLVVVDIWQWYLGRMTTVRVIYGLQWTMQACTCQPVCQTALPLCHCPRRRAPVTSDEPNGQSRSKPDNSSTSRWLIWPRRSLDITRVACMQHCRSKVLSIAYNCVSVSRLTWAICRRAMSSMWHCITSSTSISSTSSSMKVNILADCNLLHSHWPHTHTSTLCSAISTIRVQFLAHPVCQYIMLDASKVPDVGMKGCTSVRENVWNN